ncbi:histidine kinase, partial [Actinoplanes sp. NPDC051633]|uniref:sensor histidine kinase n=1 Tax=Actinoplanes sp. NPDC051633 TaxID=3155670 RepID=UPI00343C9113
MTLDRGAVLTGAALTLVGVPVGLALTGGNVNGTLTACLAVTLAGCLFLVRRWPLAALVASVASVAGMRGGDLLASGWAWPATFAFVAVVLAGRTRAAVFVGAATLLYGFVWDFFVNLDVTPNWAVVHVGGEALYLAAVLAIANAFRNNRRWRAEVTARLARDEHERELEAARLRAEERVGIARDLHDVVAHTLAVVGVHLNVALDAFDSNPGEAKESIRLAQDVRGRAMTDLRALVDVLRVGAPVEPTGGLDELDGLADQVRGAGLAVEVLETGDRAKVPAAVSTTVFRVVQEALTNVVKHAGATRVDVVLRYEDLEVTVEVIDDGVGGEAVAGGHGL